MEIRDPVHGTILLSDAETEVIDSAEFQRLRAIKQLGFAEVSFPGATHTRFLHSIGVSHLAGVVFEQIFKKTGFSKPEVKQRLKQCFKLAALLHDVGHGPLSHTIEEVMPPLKQLKIEAYQFKPTGFSSENLKATHEDYTIKYLTDSNLTEILKRNFSDILPIHIACLIDKTLKCPDDFFIDQSLDYRPILSQLVSSELDVDRMDYLERDSYFCGTNYGKVDLHWLINNLISYEKESKVFLALNRRALYTFDDFLISRHHMHLMVYFHHKSIIFEEMLNRYLISKDCQFSIPADINEYTKYTDHKLYEHLSTSQNSWAQRVSQKRPYRMLIELHNSEESDRVMNMQVALQNHSIDSIWASSKTRLSKYHATTDSDKSFQIFVIDQYDRWDQPVPIIESTQIFERYEDARIIDRLYVAPEVFTKAEKIIKEKKF
jgi:HD superfamily phosphohydrolase